MAKLIPGQPGESTTSGAEHKLFRMFLNMKDTEGWTILHSLAIAKHKTQSQGEADFVVIIPSAGVFILEVKGGGISQQNGEWYSTDRHGEVHRIKNPITEANNAMHSIRDHVSSAASRSLSRLLFGFGVVFPDTGIHGRMRTIEIADEQIADSDDCSSPESLRASLLRLATFWKRRWDSNSAVVTPSASQCAEIVELLRPCFEGQASLRSLIRNAENRLIELTENQLDTFDTISENERCIVKGSAGTGKTVLALQFTRQEERENRRTGFFCYNRQLAAYLKENAPQEEQIQCDSFTDYMEDVLKRAGRKPQISGGAARDEYYRETLPKLFEEAFLELELPQFNTLVLDEAQDLFTEQYLEAMDLILEGGLRDGRWCFFMDAERQNLFQSGKNEKDALQLLDRYHASYTKCTLKDNCRNSVAIIEKIDAIFGLNTRYKQKEERGPEVMIHSYRKVTDEKDTLETILRVLGRDGIKGESIVILSPVRFQKSAAALVTETPISDTAGAGDAVLFSTIHGFKGMESTVVILTDIDSLESEERMNLLYVGMTRAKHLLYILAQEKAAMKLRQGK